ncbi:MAG: glycosyltransferase [Cyanobacteriota bacterium]|nr:glycosyltransferase [Cyanobacteriota bacterium]
MNGLITVVMPVYGRAALVEQAIASVRNQSVPHWRLLIADDGSDPPTEALLRRLASADPRIDLVRRPRNLGLFANLNATLAEVTTPWLLILCSDDLLEPEAIAVLEGLIHRHPACQLLLSSYRSIDAAGALRFDVNGWYTDQFAPVSREFAPGELLPVLLRFGSINGNITGLLMRRDLFERTGPWRSDWRQAADWEWLIRAAERSRVWINRQPIARVRVHGGQLSNDNRVDQREGEEIAAVVRQLRDHPALAAWPQRHRWAAYHAQFLLWNALKAWPRVGWRATARQLALIHRGAGLGRTALALLAVLPGRLRIRGSDRPLPPPAP